jgi:hypothetical protein
LAPALAVRYAGGLFVLLAIVLAALAVLTAVLDLPVAVLASVAGVGVLAVLVAGLVVGRRTIVHFGADGYRVRLVRGVGVDRGPWTSVQEAVTTTRGGTPVVVLKLRDGGSTTIPVQALAADREELVRDLQRHLQHGHGLRPL